VCSSTSHPPGLSEFAAWLEPMAKSDCGLCRPLFGLICGVLMIIWGVWLTQLWFRFTPIYSDIVCVLGLPIPKQLQVGVPLLTPTSFTMEVGTHCNNPNFYTIGFGISKKGEVTIGKDKTPVGWAMESPFSHSSLPANGNGTIWITSNVKISGQMLSGLTFDLLSNQGVPLYLELNMQISVTIQFFFGELPIKKWINKKCGMSIGSLTTLASKKDFLGPMACADSWDLLTVPRLSDTGKDTMTIRGDNMDPDELRRGAMAKNLGLGGGMVIAYCSGVALVLRSCCSLCSSGGGGRRRKKISSSALSDSDSEDSFSSSDSD